MGEESIHVIRATPSHLPLVERLRASIEAEEHPADSDAPTAAVAGLHRSLDRHDFLASDAFWILLGQQDGQVVGYATAVRIPKADAGIGFLYIDELHVLRSHRRRGIATALLEEAGRLVEEKGLAGIRLVVEARNPAARALYRRVAFTENDNIFCQRRRK